MAMESFRINRVRPVPPSRPLDAIGKNYRVLIWFGNTIVLNVSMADVKAGQK